jgi:hypothetical protein
VANQLAALKSDHGAPLVGGFSDVRTIAGHLPFY